MSEAPQGILGRINQAQRKMAGDSDTAVVTRVNAKTDLKLNEKSREDIDTARAIEKAEELSKPVHEENPST